MREKKPLSFGKLTDADNMLSIYTHSLNRFLVCDIGDYQFTVVLERNESAIEQMVNARCQE